MDFIYYFICLLCYGNLIKKYRIAAILGCDLVIFKIFCPCVWLTEQEGKKEGERGGDFEEGSWCDQGANREVGFDE
jgi:hypothetical protein